MTHCTGLLGKRCSCGLFHGEGGRTFDALAHEAPAFPFAPGVIEGPDTDTTDFHQETAVRSLLATPAFWIGGALCLLPWVWLLFLILKTEGMT